MLLQNWQSEFHYTIVGLIQVLCNIDKLCIFLSWLQKKKKKNFVRSFLIGLSVGEVIGRSTSSPRYNKITTCCILDKYIQICKVKAPQNIIPPMYTQKIGKLLFLLFIQRVEGYRKEGGSRRSLGRNSLLCSVKRSHKRAVNMPKCVFGLAFAALRFSFYVFSFFFFFFFMRFPPHKRLLFMYGT